MCCCGAGSRSSSASLSGKHRPDEWVAGLPVRQTPSPSSLISPHHRAWLRRSWGGKRAVPLLSPARLLFPSLCASETCQKPVRGVEVGWQPVPGGAFVKMGLSVAALVPAAAPLPGRGRVLQPRWGGCRQPPGEGGLLGAWWDAGRGSPALLVRLGALQNRSLGTAQQWLWWLPGSPFPASCRGGDLKIRAHSSPAGVDLGIPGCCWSAAEDSREMQVRRL